MRSVAFLLLLLMPQAGFSWGAEGHRLVVRIAENLLSPPARAATAATLAPGESLSGLATWADDVRLERKDTEAWHYVNIPLDNSGLDMERDCPRGNCIVGKINDFRKTWRDAAASPATHREALLFLIHLVGDLHQPLHCADNRDKGGNQVPVRWFGEDTELHAVWDSGLLDHLPAEEILFPKLLQAATPEHVAQWTTGTVEQWANESFFLAREVAYGRLPRRRADGVVPLGESYAKMAQPTVELQLEKAGVRLAFLLNQSAR